MPTPDEKFASTRGKPTYSGENLIFVISQPRSGSTLLQRLLAGHPDIQTSAETWLMLHPVYGLRNRGIETDYRADWAAIGVRDFLEHYADGRETYLAGIRSFAQTIYGNVLDASGKKYFLDKTPRYTMIVPELVELFPKAKFVLLIRNPLAVLSSELHTYVGEKYWRLANFGPDLLDAPGRLVNARNTCGQQGISIHYEALVADPEHSIRNICSHLGIGYEPAMLDYGDRPAPLGQMNDPSGIHQHSKPTIGSLDKWKQMGSNSQHRHLALSYLDKLGTQTIGALGYDAAELRSEIEKSTVTNRVSPLYPWKLSMLPNSQRGLRDRLHSVYCFTAQQHGRVAGMFAVLRALLEKSFGSVRRLFEKTGKRQHAIDDSDTNSRQHEASPR